ncbi:MAG: NAD(P)H-dependent oxidoreductase subunit E, partial [Clostridia bacterium]|nr:NAD(P)H-dependent oxidoreductase subunit E [Clostridia bacterium]
MRLGHGHFVDAGDGIRKNVLICGGTGCTSSHSMDVRDALVKELKLAGIEDEIKVVTTGCFGLCALGPIMIVYPEGTFYSKVKPEDMHSIVTEHLVGGNPVRKLLYSETVKGNDILALDQTPFYAKQHRVALRNCGVIDPECINEYIARDGYQALAKVITTMTPKEVIQTILDSGLRGRGGAGFPTGKKWSFAEAQPQGKKYVVCNADEGDPGAFMDRSVLEGDPHAVLEAMAIAG